MDRSYKIIRQFGFKGIMSNAVDNVIPTGFVPDMQNLTVSMEGLAQNIKTPSELTLTWVNRVISTVYVLGDTRLPTSTYTGAYKDYFYVCTSIGSSPYKSGSSEPTWGATTVTDGDITWTCGELITDPIISFYHYNEWTEIYAIQIGNGVVLFEPTGNTPKGHIFTTEDPVSFASGASNDLYLYIMHFFDGLWKYLHPSWYDLTKELNQTTPRIDPISYYSGGLPPLSQKIFAYKNRLWAYGWLKEADATASAARLHWSEIPSLPEDHVTGDEIVYTDVTCLPDDEHAKDATTGLEEFTTNVTFPWSGPDYWDPFYFTDVSSTGRDDITGVVPYEQALYIFTDGGNVYTLTFYTTYDVTVQQIASNIDGVPNQLTKQLGNFVTSGKGIYYIGTKGLYAFATPNPVKISLPVQNLIDLVIDDPKGVCYFNDRVYFALHEEVWVFDVVKGTWEKFDYPFHIETIWASDHVYATTTAGEVYELDTEDSTYLTWYMDTPKIDLGNLYLEKRPEDIVVHFKIPTASSLMTILMTDEEDVDTNVVTSAETFITGRTGLLNELHYPIYKDIVKAVNFRLSGSGEVKLLGYDALFKTYHRKRI